MTQAINATESAPAAARLLRLRCEYKDNPLGLGELAPRLSWQIAAQARGARQTAYRIQVADSPEALAAGAGLAWDTGVVASDASIHVPYGGPALRSMQRCWWRAQAWINDRPTPWSEPAFWEMGLLDPADWRACWIEPGWDEDPQAQHPCPHLRAEFEARAGIASARLYATCHGLYEATLNGQPVTEDVFTPGYTAYPKRLQYQAYDVTALLRAGPNAIGVILGDGWWRGRIGASSVRNAYGTRLALLLQLRIVYADGAEQWVASDGAWKCATGPILMSDLKDGEAYDARLEMPGWNQPGFDDSAWRPVWAADYDTDALAASDGVPVRRHERLRPVKIIQTPAGETVADFGQNFAGRVRLRAQGPAGTVITLRHGETLDKAGNFTMKNLSAPMGPPLLQRVTYTLKGQGIEEYEPRFTFHGFRYVKVEAYPGTLTPDDLTGIAIYSDMAPAGSFACSDPIINQLHSNIAWSQKSNFLDIPTDCPQRERAGWTGDAQIFARTGSYLMDTAAFFTKWLKDLAAEQRDDGLVTNLVPNAFAAAGGFFNRLEGSAGWGDAAVIVPWTLYLCYGDRRVLERQYPSMQAWVDYAAGCAERLHWARRLEPSYWLDKARRARMPHVWDTGYHWGEWLEPGTGPGRLVLGVLKRLALSEPAVATAYLAYSSGLLSRIAWVLGRQEDADRYQALHERVKAAYLAEFARPGGRLKPDTQASYVRALAFELLPEDDRPAAAGRLAELVRKNGNHLGTGFLSTPYLCHVLSQHGHLDVAYDLLYQKSAPSWLYPITKGATTIWESWEGVKPDGSVQLSLNHYSYGAVGSWLHQVAAGLDLDPLTPGYQHLLIQPRPGGRLTRARTEHDTPYGPAAAGWERSESRLQVEAVVPPNTRATVRLPDAIATQVLEGGTPLAAASGIRGVRQLVGATTFEAGSGQYSFSYPIAPGRWADARV